MGRCIELITRSIPFALCLSAGPAMALEFDLGPVPIKMDNLLSVGAMMRMQNRDKDLIGRDNLNPGLCISGTPPPNQTEHGDGCANTVAGANQRYLDAEGGFN